MLNGFDSLRKVLELEVKKGYENSAVIGGLDKFLHNWAKQAAESIASRAVLSAFKKLHLAGSDYASMTKPQRKDWIKSILEFRATVAKVPPKTTQKTKTQPATTSVGVKKTGTKIEPTLDLPITTVKGISTALSAKFGKLGVKTVRDLLYFFPHRHIDYSKTKRISELTEGEEQTIIANIWEARPVRLGGRPGTEATLGDETGNIRAVWFNQPYLAKRLKTNAKLVVSGKVSIFGGRHVFESPEWELLEDKELVHTGRLVPVYPLTQGLYPRQVRKIMKEVIDRWAWQLEDQLPDETRARCGLLDLSQAITQAHFPDTEPLKDKARVRLAFDELFLLQLGVLNRKREWQASQLASSLKINLPVINRFLTSLDFKLTGAQSRVLKEVLADLAKPVPMSRLLQGEVGSGKTVVATTALLAAAADGYQGAFMAPTEILAEQHFATVCQFLGKTGQMTTENGNIRSFNGILPRPLTIALLIGDVKQAKKQELQNRISNGDIDIAIGTHALIQKGIEFKNLGLVVVDEQHRFGVAQRSALRQKGTNPHMLVMTATPIPRTLALTLYGDLDLSVIDELPPGRQVVKTKWLDPEQIDSAYAFVRRQVESGRQVFILCPLIEESEAIQARAAITEHEHLSRDIFTDLRLGLVHGRLSAIEKDEVMRRFRSGEYHILVATPVIEVGIDIPNATVMLIEGAERFGLSQLHQFRGRVGRGKEQSYCMLLAENPSEIGKKRLDLIENIRDGFKLAEEDLKLRGPGEFFGVRQSGLPDLRMAKLSDIAILEMARREAIRLFEIDPKLKRPEHRLLAKELARLWHEDAERS